MSSKNKSNYETAVMGNEPLWLDSETMTEDEVFCKLAKSLNWYNYFCSDEDYRKFVLDYFTSEDKKLAAKIKDIDKHSSIFRKIGGLCRVLSMGGRLTPKDTEVFAVHKKELIRICDTQKPQVRELVHKPNVQQHIQNKIVECISELEIKIDEFLLSDNYKEFLKSFNVESWITNNKLKSYECSAIYNYYSDKIQEPKEALTGKDSQLVEAYQHLGKIKLRKLVEFLNHIVQVAHQYSLQKKERKPRKKKTKPPEIQIKKLKFKKNEKTLNLTSIDPRDIIGATKLLVFNTKYCKVCFYESESISGFSVKGTTLQNVTKSSCKALRKPKDFFSSLGSGVRSVTNHYSALKTKEHEASPRINEHIILVKAFK